MQCADCWSHDKEKSDLEQGFKNLKLISDADELCRKECVDGCQLDEN